MSNLRIIGLIIGVIGLLATFLVYRGPKWKRSTFVFSSIFNVIIISISLDPNVINFARDLLSMQAYQYGRLIALLILSVIFLILFSFYNQTKVENIKLQLDKLIRRLGAGNFGKAIGTEHKVKPIMVVMPAYNESENLKDILLQMPDRVLGFELGVLVVDDASEDNTREVVLENGYQVVSNMINRGGGAALRLGYDILKKTGVKICITMDADGQHCSEELEKLVFPILNENCDVVIGSRILGKREKDSFIRFAGVHLFGRIISFLLGKRITDPSSGFRAFKIESLKVIDLYEDQYHTSELIIDAVKKGLNVCEVPITILKRRHGKSKKGTDWRYGLNFAKVIIKAWWR
jgi:hypothetical protein